MIVSTRKVFLFGYNPNTLTRDTVAAFLNTNRNFLNWITLLPGQIFFVADSTAAHLAATLRNQFPGQFIFVGELSPLSCDGWLPQDLWNFINNPTSAKGTEDMSF